ESENGLNGREDVLGLGPNVAWAYQPPLGIDTGMATDKHEVTDAYPVRTGNLWRELLRMDYVRPPFLTCLSHPCERRVDSESRGGQSRNGLNFDEEPLTPKPSLEGRIGRAGRLQMTIIDLMIFLIGMPVGECHLCLHEIGQ